MDAMIQQGPDMVPAILLPIIILPVSSVCAYDQSSLRCLKKSDFLSFSRASKVSHTLDNLESGSALLCDTLNALQKRARNMPPTPIDNIPWQAHHPDRQSGQPAQVRQDLRCPCPCRISLVNP